MSDDAPYRAVPPGATVLPLRSDPRWLVPALAALFAVITAAIAGYLHRLGAPRYHALLPGAALTTFAGAGIAWWGRRRGGGLALASEPSRLALVTAHDASTLVDRTRPFGALLLGEPDRAGRLLVLTQQMSPVLVYDPASRAPITDAWRSHHVSLDLGALALSPASAHVLALTPGTSLDPLIASLAPALSDEIALVAMPRRGGALTLTRTHLALGTRRITLGRDRVKVHTVDVPMGQALAALSLADDDGAGHLVVAAADPGGAHAMVDTPDVVVPAPVLAAIAVLSGIEPGVLFAAKKSAST